MTDRFRVLVAVLVLAGPALAAQIRPGGQLQIVLLVDSSSTIAPMITDFRAGLAAFLDTLPGDPEIALISTGSQMRVRVQPTTDRVKLRAAASSFSSDGGGNSLLDSLLEADQRVLKNVAERRSVFVILTSDSGGSGTVTPARINVYNKWVDDFIARGGRAHAIVVGSVNRGVTTQIAQNLARNTGGFYESIVIGNAIPKLMITMAEYVAADQ
jgi:von Willebrand factor type A domain